MSAVEVSPPYHPLNIDQRAPTVYLTGRSYGADQWHMFATDTLRQALLRTPGTVYLVDQYRVYPEIRGSAEHNEWRDHYRQRALNRGAILIWFSAAKVGTAKGKEIEGILNAKHHNPELAVVCGAGIRCSNTPMYQLREDLSEFGITLHTSLKETCQAAIAALPSR